LDRVNAPVEPRVASPDKLTDVATPPTLPTYIFPETRELDNFELKVDQSVLDNFPDLVELATGILNVCVSVREAILKSVPDVPVARVWEAAPSVFSEVTAEPLLALVSLPFASTVTLARV
jgi:hypothetical protein